MAAELAQMIHQLSKEPCRTLYLVITCGRPLMLQLRYDWSRVDVTNFGFGTEGTGPRWELAFTKASEGFAKFRLDKTETAAFVDAWWDILKKDACMAEYVCENTEIGLYSGKLGRYKCYRPDDLFEEERLVLSINNTVCSLAMLSMPKLLVKRCALPYLDYGMFYQGRTDVSQLPLQERSLC